MHRWDEAAVTICIRMISIIGNLKFHLNLLLLTHRLGK